jgi:hypothetical protein
MAGESGGAELVPMTDYLEAIGMVEYLVSL